MTNEMKCIVDIEGLQCYFRTEEGYGLIEIGNNLKLVEFQRHKDVQALNPKGVSRTINGSDILLKLEGGKLTYKGNEVVIGTTQEGF